MVKGISKQVIVVHSPEPKLFEQAIFILKEDAPEVTDEQLLLEAQRIIRNPAKPGKRRMSMYGPVWAAAGAAVTGVVWLLTSLL